MIISCLNGGLGNQIFQYATGLELSLKYDKPHFVNLLEYTLTSSRSDMLHSYIGLNTTGLPQDCQIFHEARFAYDEISVAQSAHLALVGYFQSWKYFPNAIQIIRQTWNRKYYSSGLPLLDEALVGKKIMSIHVRRGDYLTETSLDYHGLVQDETYNEVVGRLVSNHQPDIVLGFSDDSNVLGEILGRLNIPSINVSGLRLGAFNEIMLMSKCSVRMIANSSFSWWGAYLSVLEDSYTYYPSQWFVNKHDFEPDDFFPSSWHAY